MNRSPKRARKVGNDWAIATGRRPVEEFLRQAATFGAYPSPTQVDQIRSYVAEILRWNRKINLTTAKGPEELLLIHVLDSLVPLAHLSDVKSLLDVGPGAGFPGIPIKILRPELFVVLIEARRKKAAFIQHAVDRLDLKGVEVVWARLGDEEINLRFSEKPFDAMITRAALSGSQVIRLGAPLLRPGGTMLLMKGVIEEPQQVEMEQEAASLGRIVTQAVPYRLPGLKHKRNLVLIR